MDIAREEARLKKLRQTKAELIEMLEGDDPTYTQSAILKNIDERIEEKEAAIKS